MSDVNVVDPLETAINIFDLYPDVHGLSISGMTICLSVENMLTKVARDIQVTYTTFGKDVVFNTHLEIKWAMDTFKSFDQSSILDQLETTLSSGLAAGAVFKSVSWGGDAYVLESYTTPDNGISVRRAGS